MNSSEKIIGGVRSLGTLDLRGAARLHKRELSEEFLSRFGERFLASYYSTFIESPHAVALCVGDGGGPVEGVLIGAFDTRAHYSYLVRRRSFELAFYAALSAVRSPRLASDMIQTRLLRYARGVARSVGEPESAEAEESGVGFAVYVSVDSARKGRGVGKILLGEFERLCREKGLVSVEAAARPGSQGYFFLERCGWVSTEQRESRSGERYALHRRSLLDEEPAPGTPARNDGVG